MFKLSAALGLGLCALVAACSSESRTFDTPGRAPYAESDLIVSVNGVDRGFGRPELFPNQGKPLLSASMLTADAPSARQSAGLFLPSTPTTITCAETPAAVQLASTIDNHTVLWKATECTITVDTIDVQAGRTTGRFEATLERETNEVGNADVEGPRTFTVKGTFDVAR
jgi:hypothetical protein